jgi:predicted secreted protein
VTWVSYFAVFFLIWWVTLFAILPFSLRTQDDDQSVTLGTTSSAPRGSHVRRAALRTTIVSLIIFGTLWVLTTQLGYDFDDIPRIAPIID